MKRTIRTLLLLTILIANISCDQISKNIARKELGKGEEISLVNNHLILVRAENKGAFLSLGDSLPLTLRIILLMIVPAIVLGLAAVYLLRRSSLNHVTLIGTACIVGGGIGNIYDRVVRGSVTDFLHVDFVIFRTGIFNMADVSIMFGMSFILIGAQLNRKKEDGALEATGNE